MITDSQLNGYAERYLDYLKNSEGYIISLYGLMSEIRTDHILQMYFSKLNLYDIVRVVYYTYFLSKGYKQDDIFILLDKIYMFNTESYEDADTIEVECSDCYGEGQNECTRCYGDGMESCYECNGDGKRDCNKCDGDGVVECGDCDGEGTNTEEDDDGDEIEVECQYCDGRGNETCDSCGGVGNFECDFCYGSGDVECERCDGSGNRDCRECDGKGQIESDEMYYTSFYEYYYATLDNVVFSFIEKPIKTDDEIDDLENTFLIKMLYQDREDLLVSNVNHQFDTDDWESIFIVKSVKELNDSTSRDYKDLFGF